MGLEMNEQQRQAALAFISIILDTVREAGPQGCPAGPLYAALMSYGVSHTTFETMIGALVTAGLLRRSNHVLFSK